MNIPKVGSQVSVTIENPAMTSMCVWRPEHTIVSGVVQQLLPWLPNPEKFLILRTPDATCYTRIIPLNKIVAINGEKQSLASKEPKTQEKTQLRQWVVSGSKGDQYVVSMTAHGMDCSCKGFQFRRSCKHIASVEKSH